MLSDLPRGRLTWSAITQVIRPRTHVRPDRRWETRGVATRTYRLTVEGELGDQMSSAFPGMALTHDNGTTTLTGEVRDQAELQGALQRVSDLGLTLLETKVVENRPAKEPVLGSAHERR